MEMLFVMKLLLIFLVSILLTALPLVTLNFYNSGTSLLVMVGSEFLLALLSYFLYLRRLPDFSLRMRGFKNVLKIFFSYALFIISLQFIAFFIIQEQNSSPPTNLPILSVIILTIIVPVYEEIFYRGCLFSGLHLLFKDKIIAGLFTSIVFCAMHSQYTSFIDFFILFISSLSMIHMRLKTNGLLYPMMLHSIMNLAFVIINTQNIYR